MASLQRTVRNMQNLKFGTGAETAQTNEAHSGDGGASHGQNQKRWQRDGPGWELTCCVMERRVKSICQAALARDGPAGASAARHGPPVNK